MKYIIHYLLAFGLPLFALNGCIDDKTQEAYIPLSEISLEVEQDTFYADYGSDAVIPAPKVTQTVKDKELQYEWRATHVEYMGSSQREDSLKYISFEPELRYSFPRLGEFRVRLRVSNGDVSEMYTYRVFVQTPFIEGLFVLSANEQGKGRTSFLRTREESDIWKGGIFDFKTHAVEAVNRDIDLDNPTDVSVGGKSSLFITCRESQKVYLLENKTFDLLYTFDAKQELPWMKPVAILTGHEKGGGDFAKEYYLISDNGRAGGLSPLDFFLYEQPTFFPREAVYNKWYVVPGNSMTAGFFHFADSERSVINCVVSIFGGVMTMPDNSRDIFEGYRFLNLTVDGKKALWVVTVNKTNSSEVRITKFMEAVYAPAPFMGPVDLKYEPSEPLTLTEESKMVMAHADMGVGFYNNGSELYRWKYLEGDEIQKLPTESILSVEGEITSLELSTDRLFLYIGVWNPDSPEELKGSVMVYDVVGRKVVKTYPNIADKPIKVFYKYS